MSGLSLSEKGLLLALVVSVDMGSDDDDDVVVVVVSVSGVDSSADDEVGGVRKTGRSERPL